MRAVMNDGIVVATINLRSLCEDRGATFRRFADYHNARFATFRTPPKQQSSHISK
jgi:hypothetical protein